MNNEEIKEYLAKIRKTIDESNALIEQAKLRIAETDRFLEQQGLTREEVLKYNPTREQIIAVNEELKRRGLPPLQEDELSLSFDSATEALRNAEMPTETPVDDELAERRRKFGNFMQEFRL